MGMNICVGRSRKDNYSDVCVILTQELQGYLYLKGNSITEDMLLIDLDPYGDRIFNKDEIKKLKAVSEYYLSEGRLDDFEYIYDEEGDFDEDNPFDVTFFFRKLLEFCEIALKENLNLVVLGD